MTVWGELGVTVPEVLPLIDSAIVLGGQVEKKPAAEVTWEFAALITVDPGRLAVAIPLGFEVGCRSGPEVPVGSVVLSMVTTLPRDGVIGDGADIRAGAGACGNRGGAGVPSCNVVPGGQQRMAPPGPLTVVSDRKDVVSVCPWE